MFKYFIRLLFLLSGILLLFPVDESLAIPAFARKYKFSCNTCHIAAPKLKAFGEEFAGNGFMIPDGAEPKRYYVDTGDESLLLMRELPLAVRLDGYIQVADRDNAKTDFEAPYGLKFLSGGPISNHVSYYFYFYVSERGEVAGVEDAIIFFNNIGNSQFDLALGQFQISDPLFKRELRLTFEDYMVYKMKPGESAADLTYDRGLMATYGFDFGLDLTGMIVNGNGIDEAGEDRLFDLDNGKGFAARAIQGVGMFNVGGFAYYGRESMNNAAGDLIHNDITIVGPDVKIGTDTWELNGQYLYREDKNPSFLDSARKTKIKGGFAELLFMPQGDQSKFIFTFLYNRIDMENGAEDYETATLSISHMAARNLRILGELTYDAVNEKSRFTFGVSSSF